ncbi:MAG: EthD domain-containing protein [Sphingomonadaceae bacterium]
MMKFVALLKRKKNMPFDDFVARYENFHAKFAAAHLREALHYERRYISPYGNPVDGTFHEPDFDVVTEIWFKDRETLDRTMARISDVAEAFAEDEAHLFDRPATRVFTVEKELATVRASGVDS